MDVLQEVKSGKNVFFTGSAGTGKSMLLCRIVKHFEDQEHMDAVELVVTASTGLAAMNIGGCTIHSWAGIGPGRGTVKDLLPRIVGRQRYDRMCQDGPSTSRLENFHRLPTSMQRWLLCKVLIIDESAYTLFMLAFNPTETRYRT